MATTPVVPTSTAAPSAPAVSTAAPVSPVSPPSATPAAPVTPVSPAAVVPPAESAAVETTSTASTTTGTATTEPKQTDFPGDVAGFLEAHSAWERDGGETIEAPGETEQVSTETQTAEEIAQQAQETEQVEQKATEPEAPVTPESLNALMAKSPELKAALEASPEVKNALFSMARINAKAAPILEILPNVEAAQFAAETSNKFVTIRSNFMDAIDSPESLPAAYSQFAEEFAQRNPDGSVKKDEQGNPVYDQDFHMLNDYIVDSYHGVEIEDLEAAAAAGNLPENDELALQALKYIKEWKSGRNDGPAKPNLDGLTPEARAYIEQREKELSDREAKLNGTEKQMTAEQRKQERQTFETNVARKVGSSVGSRIKSLVDASDAAGVFIPTYVTQAKDPETGISVFAQNLLDQFEEKTYGRRDRKTGQIVGGVAQIRNTAKSLALRPPSPEAEKARVDFAMQLIEDHLPSIYESELRKIQNQEIQDRQRRQGKAEKREQLTSREPQGGNAPAPRAMDAKAAMSEAYKWVDQNFPDISQVERTAKALVKKDDFIAGRR